ncbi:MAG: DUF2269 family protein [Gemmatimonadales bacterium]
MYLALKTLHVLAVVLFLGNIITGIFWKAHADRTGDARIIAHVMDGIIWSDRVFTVPGVVLLTIFGMAAAITGRLPILGTGWIWQGIVLLGIAGIVFGFRLAPLQRAMREVARQGASGGPWDTAAYAKLSKQWAFWGVVALVTPLAAVFLMVLKPAS